MIEFSDWDMVFSTKEEATYNGHPSAPNLANYGLEYEQLKKYIHQNEDIRKKRRTDKFDNTLNTIWFILFTIGPFIIMMAASDKALGVVILIMYYILITLGTYLWHKLHFDAYEKMINDIHDRNMEFYMMSVEKYKRNYYQLLSRGEIEEAHPIYEPESSLALLEDRPFYPNEIAAIQSAVIVDSGQNDGKPFVSFTLKKFGSCSYIPLSEKSQKRVGDSVDIKQLRMLKYKMKSGHYYECIMC